MTLTPELLQELTFTSPLSVVAPFAGPLNQLMPAWGVDSPLRRAHFLAQICHESAAFTRLVENLHYTHVSAIVRVFPHLSIRAASLVNNPQALANAAYANRGGNGDEASGDGWRYRGRGLIQVTLKNNYLRIGAAIDTDLVGSPDALIEPRMAVLSALAFWKLGDCNVPADADNVPNVTRIINPGLAGLADRSILKKRALDLKL